MRSCPRIKPTYLQNLVSYQQSSHVLCSSGQLLLRAPRTKTVFGCCAFPSLHKFGMVHLSPSEVSHHCSISDTISEPTVFSHNPFHPPSDCPHLRFTFSQLWGITKFISLHYYCCWYCCCIFIESDAWGIAEIRRFVLRIGLEITDWFFVRKIK